MIDEIRGAYSFLTILPVGSRTSRDAGKSFAWFPLVGLFIGACLLAVAAISPFDRELTAALILICWVVLSGGLHLDGFADSCDGLLGHGEAQKRLAIMRDPGLGTWGAAGLVLLLLTKWLAIGAIDPALLILPPLFGRWAMVLAAYHFPYAREKGIGAVFREGLGPRQLLISSVIVGIVVFHYSAFFLWLLALLVALAVGRWASTRLGGGLTGDVYGAICELSELACLLGMGVIHA
ncbi:MAG: adenosylcobinamide-GDP ribazoletransferase [Chloroflexi bacterium]|nr:adenosylcobinamide-GDP ribazoletransferase [Chloroflexota bacterium]